MTTYGELKTDVTGELDLDVADADVVNDAELIRVVNKAIEECVNIIYALNQDYYKSSSFFNLVDGTSSYAMPTNIYANKLRYIQYDDGLESYEVLRIKDKDKSAVLANDDYQYDIENTYAAQTKFVLYPASRSTDATLIKAWFIRTFIPVTGDATVIDLPSTLYVRARVKEYLMDKMGHPLMQKAMVETGVALERFKTTFETMIPNEEESMEEDYSHYEEHI